MSALLFVDDGCCDRIKSPDLFLLMG